jgi:hypothetical protein
MLQQRSLCRTKTGGRTQPTAIAQMSKFDCSRGFAASSHTVAEHPLATLHMHKASRLSPQHTFNNGVIQPVAAGVAVALLRRSNNRLFLFLGVSVLLYCSSSGSTSKPCKQLQQLQKQHVPQVPPGPRTQSRGCEASANQTSL